MVYHKSVYALYLRSAYIDYMWIFLGIIHNLYDFQSTSFRVPQLNLL